MKQILDEFKKFAIKGNMFDMAIGIMIGSTFSRVISSLVEDVLMPPLGVILGGMNFTDYKFILRSEVTDETGKLIAPVVLRYGTFLQTVLNFLIVALAMFAVVKLINIFKDHWHKKEAEKSTVMPQDILLLTEIRDLLAKKSK